jgi:GNAT superfamily N-acetyltransferase
MPDGFTFTTGDKLGPEKKALAHAKAFGYINSDTYLKRAEIGFAKLAEMPDYRAELDIFIIDQTGEPASFASMWYDSRNQIAMLEPMGTLPDYRRMGLGSLALHEGIRRCQNLGAGKSYGGDQQFYYDIGFKVEFTYEIWKKIL